MRFLTRLLCALALTLPAAPAAVHVSPDGRDEDDGTSARPVATLERARDLARTQPDRTIIVGAGTYYLTKPLHLGPEDAGLRIQAAPGSRPVISGGRVIGDWQKGDGSLWQARVEPGLDFSLMRAGEEPQILARTPNFDPQDPIKGGWFFVDRPPVTGEYGKGIGGLHSGGDWVEWRITVPRAGRYAFWMRYAGVNAPYFGPTGMSGNSHLQVDGDEPVVLTSLPDTEGWDKFAWHRAATLDLSAGTHTLRWRNNKGGGINWDASALCSDEHWQPTGTDLAPPANGDLIVVQAEAYHQAEGKDLNVAETKPAVFKDHFRYRPGDLAAYPSSPEPRLHLFPAWGWVNTILQLDRIDPAQNEAWVKPNKSASEEIWPGNRYFISNIREGLDQPGEWWFDRKAATLYWWPRDEAALQQATIAAVLKRLITINDTEDIRIEGLEFRDTDYSLQIGVYSPNDAAISVENARRCVIEGNRFVGLGGYALRIGKGGNQNEFIGNEVSHGGQGGVLLEGSGDARPADTVISGNWMHHLGQVYKHVAAVYGLTATRTRVAHNLFEHLPRYATSFKSFHPGEGSHGNIVEYNDIRHTNLETNDTGAIEFLGRDKALSGNIVRYNRILDVVGLQTNQKGEIISPYMTWAIYLDDYTSGVHIHGNIAARYTWGAVGLHAGRENLIEDNIFVDGAKQQMWYAPRDGFSADNRFRRNIVAFRGSAPQLIHRSDHAPAEPLNRVLTECNHNIYWNTTDRAVFTDKSDLTPAGTFPQWQEAGYDRESLIVDPGFVNADKDDFRLQPGSPADRIGFPPIPHDKIGLPGEPRAWRQNGH